MKIAPSIRIAGGIVVALVLYFVLRNPVSQTDTVATNDEPAFTVITAQANAQEWRDVVTIRGETQAMRKVIVRAETSGVVSETPIDQGTEVKQGDLLCKLSVDARAAQLNEARATLNKARLDYDAAKALSAEGFQSQTGVAGAKAALDLAAASMERASVELAKTKIIAPFDGVFDARDVDVGDFISVGAACGTVIQRDPYLITGTVSEKVVARITKGDRGVATLATGETVDGIVRFVAAAADPVTRTFRIELETPNPDGRLRDGVTAQFDVFARNRRAHILPRSAVVLNENGVTGVKTLDSDNTVVFNPITLLDDTAEGIWVSGLDGNVMIIVRGQNYVRPGETVAFKLESDAS